MWHFIKIKLFAILFLSELYEFAKIIIITQTEGQKHWVADVIYVFSFYSINLGFITYFQTIDLKKFKLRQYIIFLFQMCIVWFMSCRQVGTFEFVVSICQFLQAQQQHNLTIKMKKVEKNVKSSMSILYIRVQLIFCFRLGI